MCWGSTLGFEAKASEKKCTFLPSFITEFLLWVRHWGEKWQSRLDICPYGSIRKTKLNDCTNTYITTKCAKCCEMKGKENKQWERNESPSRTFHINYFSWMLLTQCLPHGKHLMLVFWAIATSAFSVHSTICIKDILCAWYYYRSWRHSSISL